MSLLPIPTISICRYSLTVRSTPDNCTGTDSRNDTVVTTVVVRFVSDRGPLRVVEHHETTTSDGLPTERSSRAGDD